jgi:thiol-disulfide isomerase/thioredoxin
VKLILTFCLLLTQNALALPKDIQLVDLKGQPVSSPEKKHLVLFWASWCKDCKVHLKNEIPELAKKYSVIAINIDGTAARAKASMNDAGITFPSYRDESKKMQKELKAFVTPFWAVYDGNKLVDSYAGFDLPRIERALK